MPTEIKALLSNSDRVHRTLIPQGLTFVKNIDSSSSVIYDYPGYFTKGFCFNHICSTDNYNQMKLWNNFTSSLITS